MKKFLKIFAAVVFAALLLGTFWFLWQKTRPAKVVYTIVEPVPDTLKQFVVATGKVDSIVYDERQPKKGALRRILR